MPVQGKVCPQNILFYEKEKLTLSKKLLLKKEAIVELNQQQQSKLVGGAPVTYWSACCVETNEVTCPVDCIR